MSSLTNWVSSYKNKNAQMIKERADTCCRLIKNGGVIAIVSIAIFNPPMTVLSTAAWGALWFSCRKISSLCNETSSVSDNSNKWLYSYKEILNSKVDRNFRLIKGVGISGNLFLYCFDSSILPSWTIAWGLSCLACRTLSYLSAKNNPLDSNVDRRYHLKISDQVKVAVIYRFHENLQLDETNKIYKICKKLKLTTFNIAISESNTEIRRIEFIASKMQFKELLSLDSDLQLKYNFTPLYDYVANQRLPNNPVISFFNSFSETHTNFKISSLLNLIVITPPRFKPGVSKAIENNRTKPETHEGIQNNHSKRSSSPIFTEQGNGRWQTLGQAKISSYKSCEQLGEIKITSEICQSRILKTLYEVSKSHKYKEIGYDINILWEVSHCKTPLVEKLKSEFFKFTALLFLNKSLNLKLSNDVKLIVYSPVEYADNVRYIAGKNGAGIMGNYAYCSFTTQILEKKERIEMVVVKKIFQRVQSALEAYKRQKNISYHFHPLFERIDTKTLNEMQYLDGCFV